MLHSFCIAEANREIADVDGNAKENSNLCSVTCYRFSMIDGLTSEAVKLEGALLAQKNKEQLKKEARELQIKVNCRVNGSSRDASKELIKARSLEKKIFQQYAPGDRIPSSNSETLPRPAKFGLNDKFCLINVIFSDELCDCALTSEQSATQAELDTGKVGHRSPFWQMVENHFNEGFPPDGVDGRTFGDS